MNVLLGQMQDVNTTGTLSTQDLIPTSSGLMMAAMSNQAEVVARLVKIESLDINLRGMQENTALTFAAGQVHLAKCHQLVLILTSGLQRHYAPPSQIGCRPKRHQFFRQFKFRSGGFSYK